MQKYLKNPIEFRSIIRGGGAVGGNPWMATITGSDPKFGLRREFLPKDRHTSGSGRSGSIHFTVHCPGLYEYRGIGTQEQSINSQRSTGGDAGFVRVRHTGQRIEYSKHDVLRLVQRFERLNAR